MVDLRTLDVCLFVNGANVHHAGTHIAGFLAPPHPEKGDLSTTSLGSARKRVHSQLMHWFILTPEVKAYIAAVMNWHPIPDWQLSLRTDAYAAWRSGGYNADTLELFSSPVRTFPASVRLIPNGCADNKKP